MTKKTHPGKKRLSREILGIMVLLLVLSMVVFSLLCSVATVMIERVFESRGIVLDELQEINLGNLIFNVSLLVSVAFFIILFLVITGERLSTALNQVRDKERALSEERELLIRTLSHDIRTPLTSVISYSELLTSGENIPEDKKQEHLLLIHKKAGQIKELTDILLDGGSRNPEFFEDAGLLMKQLAAEFEEVLEDTFKVTVDLSRCHKFTGRFDVRELHRIFDNLISNIEKYADPNQPVTLSVSSEGSMLVIRQSNSAKAGCALAESHRMGIISIRRIAHNYAGSVDVNTTGSEFEITITLSEF
ncbi:MAG: HAMP domain-containing histidine kinase [Firmicutes bacterium]|nr:HAMP domain-containing histidine kinase [Bacillota bacterium]